MFNLKKNNPALEKAQKELKALMRLLRERDERIAALQARLDSSEKERALAEERTREATEERRKVTDKLLVISGCGSLYETATLTDMPQKVEEGNAGDYPTNMREFVSKAEMDMAKELAEARRRNIAAEARDKGFKAMEEAAEIATSPVEEEIPA